MNLQDALGLTADELCELQERADAEGWEAIVAAPEEE